MDTLRLERFAWSVLVGGVLAAFAVLLVSPDPTGAVSLAAVVLATVAAVPLVYRFLAWTAPADARVGDLTTQWVTLFAVTAGLRVLFGAVGLGGSVARVASLVLGYAAATQAERWNPLRRRGGASA